MRDESLPVTGVELMTGFGIMLHRSGLVPDIRTEKAPTRQ